MIQGVSMNASSVRPQARFAAALVAAGVVSAASVVGVPEEYRALPAINADVANASVITDLLYDFGDAVNAVASGAAWTGDAAASLPFDAFTAIAIAAQNPSLGPNLLSWLVYRYVNPSDDYLPFTYPWSIKDDSIFPLAELLPYPLGPGTMDDGLIINAVNQFADAINNALSGLPDPLPGVFATDAFRDTDIGRVVLAANNAVIAPVWMMYETAFYLGYLPADLEATFESAIQDPSEIPGLVSNLVYDLLSPDPEFGLLGGLLFYATLPLTTLPGLIGEMATNIVAGISDGIDNVLSLLPAPIEPTPFPSPSQDSALLSVMSDETNLVSDASITADSSITLSTDLVEKKVEAPEELNTAPATPEDLGPAAADVDPDADKDGSGPPADVVTNKVRSGNKVNPGDKFDDQVKGATVTDDGAAAPAGDEVEADPTVATDPTDTEAEGADDPAPADAEPAA
jgi:hypothetical protein